MGNSCFIKIENQEGLIFNKYKGNIQIIRPFLDLCRDKGLKNIGEVYKVSKDLFEHTEYITESYFKIKADNGVYVLNDNLEIIRRDNYGKSIKVNTDSMDYIENYFLFKMNYQVKNVTDIVKYNNFLLTTQMIGRFFLYETYKVIKLSENVIISLEKKLASKFSSIFFSVDVKLYYKDNKEGKKLISNFEVFFYEFECISSFNVDKHLSELSDKLLLNLYIQINALKYTNLDYNKFLVFDF